MMLFNYHFMNFVVCGYYILFDNRSSTELNKQCERDSETGNKKASKSLHNVIEEGGHALDNNETETKAMACKNSYIISLLVSFDLQHNLVVEILADIHLLLLKFHRH